MCLLVSRITITVFDRDWLYVIKLSNQIDSKVKACKGPFNDTLLTVLILGIFSFNISINISV